jgi:hypothetical protein
MTNLTGAPERADHGTVHPFPAMRPGFRLAPAAVGRDGRTQIVGIFCPAWCTESHVDEPVGNVEDVMHRGDQSELTVESFAFAPIPHQLYAYLAADPVASNELLRSTHVVVDNADGSQSAFLTPEMAETVADNAVKFASQLRTLARTARLHNQHAAEVAA